MPESSRSFKTEPISNLLKRPLKDMTQEELREFVTRTRQLRSTPQTLKSLLESELDETEIATVKKPKKASKPIDVSDLLSDEE